jgi:hypothetical protein
MVSRESCYLCAYRPSQPTADLRTWVDATLAHPDAWQWITVVDPTTGEIQRETAIYELTRPQTWVHPATEQTVTWTERVLVTRRQSIHATHQRHRERALEKLTQALEKLRQPPIRGRKYYRHRADLDAVVQALIARAALTDIVTVTLAAEQVPSGATRWIVERITVNWQGWHTMMARLGWQVYLSNTTTAQYVSRALVGVYRQQVVEERGFSRLKTRNLQIRPLYLRDEQRIAGLVWLLCLALRILTLTEQRVRWALDAQQERIVGLTPGAPTQATQRPTTERLIRAFNNITLTIVTMDGACQGYVTALTATQRHILTLLHLSPALYEGLETAILNFYGHLRE